MLFVCRAHALDLADVPFGMFRIPSEQIKQRDRADFRVLSGTRESVLGQILQEIIILRPRAAKRFERLRDLALSVIEMVRPSLSVERPQNRVLLR